MVEPVVKLKSVDEAAGFDTAEALAIRLNEELGISMLPNILNMLIRAGDVV